MLKKHMAGCLMATALMAGPALAQTNTTTTMPAHQAGTAMSAQVTPGQFVDKAANSNMFEIQSSQAALDKTQNQRIREFAQRMITDHTQAGDKLNAAAQGETVPMSLDGEHTQMVNKLKGESGASFERDYVTMQIDGHEKAVNLFQTYGQNGTDAQLKQFAQQTLPTLKQHLDMITRIRDDMYPPARMGQNNQAPMAGQTQASATGQNVAVAVPVAVAYITVERPDLWRASKLTGLNVYNQANQKIGDINEVLVDRNGRAEGVVIGVGGFLGIGEHDVAVPFNALQWSTTPISATATTGTVASTTMAAGTAMTTRPVASANRDYPDHAVLPNATKAELEKAPQFKYNR